MRAIICLLFQVLCLVNFGISVPLFLFLNKFRLFNTLSMFRHLGGHEDCCYETIAPWCLQTIRDDIVVLRRNDISSNRVLNSCRKEKGCLLVSDVHVNMERWLRYVVKAMSDRQQYFPGLF